LNLKILILCFRNPVVNETAKSEFEKYLQVINDDETENYKEGADDHQIKTFLLADFSDESKSMEDWLVSRNLRKTSKKIPFFIDLKQSKI
jgi:hypothetical protein